MSDDLCHCRDCDGNPCLCRLGDHCDWKTPHCSCCGDVNYRWLGYLGARARWAREWNMTPEQVEARWSEEAVAALEEE